MKDALRVSAVYTVAGVFWFFISDILIEYFRLNAFYQTYKELFYILLTGILLFFIVQKLNKQYERELLRRRETEKKLNESERFAGLFDHVTSGLVVTDPNQKDNPIIYVNKGFERLTGFTSKEVIGKNFDILRGGSTSESDKEKIKHAVQNKTPLQIEIGNYKKNGQFFWNELKISPITNENGAIKYFIGIQNDITERKKQSILLENQFRIIKALLTFKGQPKAFEEICLIIEEHMDYQCLIFECDQKKEKLTALASASLPSAFLEEISDFPIQKSEGVTGEAVFQKKTMVMDHVDGKMQNKKYVKIAKKYGIQSIWSTPIITAEGNVFGALTMYKKIPYHPSESELQTLETYAYIIGLVMENMQYQKQVKKSEQRYQFIADNVTDIICLLDEKKEITYISPAISQLVGEQGIEVLWEEKLPAKMINRIEKFVNYLYQVDSIETMETEVIDFKGNIHWLEIKGRKIVDENGKRNTLLVARDITSLKKYQESLDKILYYDSLTQLPNKYRLRKDLEDFIQSNHHFYFVMLDFVNMKEIKRIYGTEIWDNILLKMKNKILHLFDPAYLSRSGEDEYCFLLTEDTKSTLQGKLNQFNSMLHSPWKFDQQELMITPSIGIVFNHKQTADRMLLQAQEALQETRENGNTNIIFYEDHFSTNKQNRSVLIKKNLFKAIDNDELEVVYQPQVDTEKGKVIGFEALVRWQNNELGNVPPGEFIPIAEETGWIIPVGDYVINQVINDILYWEKEGSSFEVSINISYKQLEEGDLPRKIRERLECMEFPADRLSFEITESLLIENIDLSIVVLQQLHELGIRIEVDDFGVGYSSLSYLRKFPIDALKIDRSFVENIHRDSKELAIVQAIMEMSRALELEVIAEGVENKKQVQLLQELGCKIYQGFWFSKPLKKKDIDTVLSMIHQKKIPELLTPSPFS
ncbi:EAL domain-containing protein [Gracilibacillus xinjiangensis]|uniref:EAL domain-containing protein n=1 Tax=Gracilibacillus xinjiangensis TaxID=1193282 RepID=A0ABV8WUE5_9BACI